LDTKIVVRFFLKKCDLAFVLLLVVKKTIPFDPLASDTPNRLDLDDRMLGRFPLMVTEEIMAWREVKVRYFKIAHYAPYAAWPRISTKLA
jgi:hypothetical protein